MSPVFWDLRGGRCNCVWLYACGRCACVCVRCVWWVVVVRVRMCVEFLKVRSGPNYGIEDRNYHVGVIWYTKGVG